MIALLGFVKVQDILICRSSCMYASTLYHTHVVSEVMMDSNTMYIYSPFYYPPTTGARVESLKRLFRTLMHLVGLDSCTFLCRTQGR